ncbi:MAG TPA: hypothetical protein VM638_07520, partial [Actinomycetota bacterium]|nr:hypothetical protein [Actinomycetota bacterium]
AEASAGAVTARAFAPLERAWPVARRILQPGGSFVYFAGGSMEDPLAEARRVAGSEAQARLLESAPPLVIMTRR